MSAQLTFTLARRFLSGRTGGRFAPAVALIATLGITVGIAALIVVSSVMAGLEGQLQRVVLSTTPHVTVTLPGEEDKERLVAALSGVDNVAALCPSVSGEVLIQSEDGLYPVILEGLDTDRATLLHPAEGGLKLPPVPPEGSYALSLSAALFESLNLTFSSRVRVIATRNARYTALGLTPTTRLFTVTDYRKRTASAGSARALTAYADARRLLRLWAGAQTFRLFLNDPAALSSTTEVLDRLKLSYHTWQEEEGEFFEAVGMERLAMGVMLFLIVMVAAFNLLSSLTMMVSSRLKEIAILKTLGLSDGAVRTLFFTMGGALSAGGILLGTAAGCLLSLNAQGLLSLLGLNLTGGAPLPVKLDPLSIALVGLISLSLSLICVAVPAFKASSVAAAHCLEHSA